MKISELDDFTKNNPHLTQIPQAPMIVDPTRVMGAGPKPDSDFVDVLKTIKKNNYGSTIDV